MRGGKTCEPISSVVRLLGLLNFTKTTKFTRRICECVSPPPLPPPPHPSRPLLQLECCASPVVAAASPLTRQRSSPHMKRTRSEDGALAAGPPVSPGPASTCLFDLPQDMHNCILWFVADELFTIGNLKQRSFEWEEFAHMADNDARSERYIKDCDEDALISDLPPPEYHDTSFMGEYLYASFRHLRTLAATCRAYQNILGPVWVALCRTLAHRCHGMRRTLGPQVRRLNFLAQYDMFEPRAAELTLLCTFYHDMHLASAPLSFTSLTPYRIDSEWSMRNLYLISREQHPIHNHGIHQFGCPLFVILALDDTNGISLRLVDPKAPIRIPRITPDVPPGDITPAVNDYILEILERSPASQHIWIESIQSMPLPHNAAIVMQAATAALPALREWYRAYVDCHVMQELRTIVELADEAYEASVDGQGFFKHTGRHCDIRV